MNQQCNEKLYTLTEACELLSISTATGRNWMKSGRLVSIAGSGQKPRFAEPALLALKQGLSDGTISGLKGRRNKSYVNGTSSYHAYISKDSNNHTSLKQLLTLLEQEKTIMENSLLLCLLRHCAEQLIAAAGYRNFTIYESLLNALVPAEEYASFMQSNSSINKVSYSYYPEEDTLGFLYQSLCSLRDRKGSGAYYTPMWLANCLVSKHLSMADETKTILDPSCGTGMFLLQLPKNLPLQNLHGTDLDPVSIAIARINLSLKYGISSYEEMETIKHNITVSDYLEATNTTTYDIILGNPPWGATLSTQQKTDYRANFSCAGTSVEIYDLFIEQSIKCLNQNGVLSFVLPEALLTVKNHTPARRLLLQNTAVLSVQYLGEVFEQVHCPSIILTVTKTNMRPFFKNVIVTLENGQTFSTKVERIISADFFSFAQTDEETLLLEKIFSCRNHTTLVEQADFALGIVTGNNASLLHSVPFPGSEPIIKGSDISKYHINSHSGYLAFQPDSFQQTAPEHFYRAPEKLFYRFINKKLIFAYDNTGLLSLNSCNILIPRIKGLSIKYVLAILNSGVAQFVFEKKFRSVKVLRSHLEQLPIPLADTKTQAELIELVELLLAQKENSPEYTKTYSRLDQKIAELFGLTAEEYKLISSERILSN